MKPDHEAILSKAKECAKIPEDIPKIETLHQNICHMTVALKEVETRLFRVANKMRRLNIEEDETFMLPLVKCIATLKEQIEASRKELERF